MEILRNQIINTFIEGFIFEEKQFYHMGEDGFYLYGFKFKDGIMVVVGFKIEDSKELLEKILYQQEDFTAFVYNSRGISILVVKDTLFYETCGERKFNFNSERNQKILL